MKKNIITTIIITGGLALALTGVAQKVGLNPIKPSASQKAPLTDEQQSILAVRSNKPAVVSILGTPTSTTSTSGGLSLTITPLQSVAGTGFIVDQNGLIISNNHVVSDSSLDYTVTLVDGTEYKAKVLGLDKSDDIAILKIDAENLPVVKLGDSSQLETGQTVFAIGNSLGKYQDSVTKGVISGLGRSLAVPEDNAGAPLPRLLNLIQTDAAINLGNSGGPLIDMSGSVVGMNTLIDTGGSSLGFSIPINTIKAAVSQLQSTGKVSKSYMGVQFVTVDGQIKVLKNLSLGQGAYIDKVADGSPAAAAGIKPGDVITAINHEKLGQSNELDVLVGKYAPGTQILVTYVRGTEQNDAALVLGVLP